MSAQEPAAWPAARVEPRLAGKVALVTGAGVSGSFPGTGAATAYLLALEGARVVVVDKDPERAGQTVARIAASGGSAIAAICDITDPASCQEAVRATVAEFGRLDVLVNNAGVDTGAIEKDDPGAAWEQALAVNLTGARNMCAAAERQLFKQNSAAIINVASIAGVRAFRTLAYSASKGGLIAYSRALAATYGLAAGVRVNCIAPGFVHTPMGNAGAKALLRDVRRNATLLRTEGTAWDVAYAALFLASDEARWITGIVLPVDAGTTATTFMTFHGIDPRGESA